MNTYPFGTAKTYNTRGSFGAAFLQLAEENPDVLAVTADLELSTKLRPFAQKYPHRMFNTGIAEQNMVSFAAGLSRAGYTVFAASFAPFITMRPCEQVRLDVCYNNANVKLVGAAAGVGLGTQGNTHYVFEDLALLRAFPNLTILSPSDESSIYRAVQAAAAINGPVYIRMTGEGASPMVYTEDYPFTVGKAVRLREGGDVAILASGRLVAEANQAAALLEQRGIFASVADVHTIKPFDTGAVEAGKQARLMVTVEEHSRTGGLGGAVAEVMAEQGGYPPLLRIGMPDEFSKVGTYEDQLERFGFLGPQIAHSIEQRL